MIGLWINLKTVTNEMFMVPQHRINIKRLIELINTSGLMVTWRGVWLPRPIFSAWPVIAVLSWQYRLPKEINKTCINSSSDHLRAVETRYENNTDILSLYGVNMTGVFAKSCLYLHIQQIQSNISISISIWSLPPDECPIFTFLAPFWSSPSPQGISGSLAASH